MSQLPTKPSQNWHCTVHFGTVWYGLVRFGTVRLTYLCSVQVGTAYFSVQVGFLHAITVIIIRRKELLPTVTISRVLITIAPAFPAEMELLQEMNANPLRWRRRWWTTQFSIRIRVSPIWHGEMEKPTRKITTSVNFKQCLNIIFQYLYKIA